MPVYYTGLNASPLFSDQDGIIILISHLTQIPFSGITDIEIGWNYFLLWQDKKLYITGKISENDDKNGPYLIQIPEESSGSCKMAIPGRDYVVILSTHNEIWKYKIYDNSWQKVTSFISSNDNVQAEYAIKLSQAGCTVILTNLGVCAMKNNILTRKYIKEPPSNFYELRIYCKTEKIRDVFFSIYPYPFLLFFCKLPCFLQDSK